MNKELTLTAITVNPGHNYNSNGEYNYNIKCDAVNKWLLDYGLEFNHDYGVGWDWTTDEVNLTPVITFSAHVDPRIITAFALRWS